MKVLRSHRSLAMTFLAVAILILAGCGGNYKKPATLTSVAVTPKNPTIVLGATQQFTATGTYSDNSTKDLTSSVTWSSGTAATATISTGGLATSLAGGTSAIKATSGTLSDSTTLTVITLVSIAVTPASPASLGVGGTQQFTATGTYSDTSTKDITATVTWASATLANATITASGGLATAVHTGTSKITATLGTVVSPFVTLTVIAPTLVSIQISPTNPTIPVGGTVDFTGVGLLSDSTTVSVSPITWSTTSPANSVSINSQSDVGITLGLVAGVYPIKAVGGGVNGTTQLTVVAAATRFAYVANAHDGSISVYAVNGSAFTLRGYATDSHSALQSIPDPSGKFVFALNNDNTISTYGVDSASGALTDLSTATIPVVPVPNSGSTGPFLPYQGSIDPTGRFLYVANQFEADGVTAADNVTAFSINTVNGSLAQIAGSPFAVGSAPAMAITDRTGAFLYVVNSGDGTISGFPINASTGALGVPLTGSPYATGVGSNPFIAAIDPTNSFLYVADFANSTIVGYKITAGVLAPLTGSPFDAGSLVDAGPDAVVVDPSGKFVYASNFNTETISSFTIGTGGTAGQLTALGSPISVSPTGAQIGNTNSNGSSPFSLSMDPAGNFIAVANEGTNSVALFSLNEATGALTSAGNIETRSQPEYVNLYIAASAPTLAPAAVFATNTTATAGSISAYTAVAGVLTPAAAPAGAVAGNSAATTDVTGQFFFASVNGTLKEFLGFGVTQSTAALTALTNSPSALGLIPGAVISEPSDRFVYAAETGAPGSILGFTLDTTTGTILPIAGPLAVANLKSMVADPQGQNIYTLGVNLIEQVTIGGADGTLTTSAGQTITPTGTWASGAVDASGQYLFALDTAGKSVTVFFIGPTSQQILPALPAPVAFGAVILTKSAGTSPASLVLSPDPASRFVYVIDSGANSITGYTFDPLAATLTAITSGTAALGGLPGQATIDATGKFLYVAVEGNPATNAGSVAGFQINANGTLTPLTSSPYAAGVGTTGVAVSNSIK